MPLKLGNGGNGLEEYNEHDGRYKTDGVPNKSYDNPNEQKILDSLGLSNENSQGKNYGEKRKQLPYWGENILSKYGMVSYLDLKYDTSLSVEEKKHIIKQCNIQAVKMLKQETGYSTEESIKLFNCLAQYFGGDFSSFKNNKRPDDTKIIDDGLSRMGKYDGVVYRGMSFDREKENEIFLKFVSGLQVGNTMDMSGISSWSSSEQVAKDYASISTDVFDEEEYNKYHSVILVLRNNKTGVGTQHISKFGDGESEVLFPSTAKWKIVNKKETNQQGKQTITVEVEEL